MTIPTAPTAEAITDLLSNLVLEDWSTAGNAKRGDGDEIKGKSALENTDDSQTIHKSVESEQKTKYNSITQAELLKRYEADVAAGWISPLSGFENYERLYSDIQSNLVGKKLPNQTTVTGQSRHFMQRVIGTMSDPKELHDNLRVVRRSGVEIADIYQAVLYGESGPIRTDANGNRSQRFQSERCTVTVNPDNGTLIQCNPI